MKKSSTAVAQSKRNFDQKLTIGLDLGDRSSWYCGGGPSLERNLPACVLRWRVERASS